MPKRTIILLSVFLAVFVLAGSVEAQCAMCKQAAASSLDNNPNSIAKGLNSGILYLMAVPYLLILFIFRKQIQSLWKKLRSKETV
jgi:hypothetical protein